MMMLATVLQQDFQTHYSPERALPQLLGEREPSFVFFADSQDLFLHGLLGGKRQGTCSSLPVLYAAVAQRLGYPVHLASAKGHFYVRYEDGSEHLNVEATSIGYNNYPDEFYRKWPFPTSEEEVRSYGLLRPLSKQEILGTFLTIRANCLTSMKSFDAAAETWAQAARQLPETPTLKQIVAHARDRANNEQAADRWDNLWEEVAGLPVPADPDYAELRDKRLRLMRLMNQNTNLMMIEQVVAELKTELSARLRREALASDSPQVQLIKPTNDLRETLQTSEIAQLLALSAAPLPRRIQIPAERVPQEYWQAIPPELQDRLRGLSKEAEIVSEMNAYHAEQMNRGNQEATAAQVLKAPQTLPANVRPEWLPAEYQQAIPAELRQRLVGQNSAAQVQAEIHRFHLDVENRRRAAEMRTLMQKPFEPGRPNLPLTTPPLQIEIVPTKIGEP